MTVYQNQATPTISGSARNKRRRRRLIYVDIDEVEYSKDRQEEVLQGLV